ncbi:hypothetical protein H5T87_01250 [bacterium]|nr:hypothetical protein [bacterium]
MVCKIEALTQRYVLHPLYADSYDTQPETSSYSPLDVSWDLVQTRKKKIYSPFSLTSTKGSSFSVITSFRKSAVA